VRNRAILFLSSLLCLCLGLIALPGSAYGFTTLPLNPSSCTQKIYQPGWVAAENAKPGVPHWDRLVKHAKNGGVSGWFDQTSAVCGQDVGLHLSGTGRSVLIRIYRMGYYEGARARLVFTEKVKRVPKASAPVVAQDDTYLTTTNWPTTTSILIDNNFPTGIYMARFDDGGKAGYAPLVIRNDVSTSALLMVASTLTWEAYNTYGGWSLYHGPKSAIQIPGRMVSFDRPYDRDGESNFTVNDAGIVQSAESLGLDISYTDDVYLDGNPDVLLNHHSVIYDGHSEYWSSSMRSAALNARDSGVNLLFLGANSAYWRIQLVANGRQIICWKGSPSDPFAKDALLITNKWGQAPTAFNESELLGALMAGIGVNAHYQVENADVWPLAGTGIKTGDVIAGVVGKEVETTDIGIAPAVQTFLTSKVEIGKFTYNVNLSYYTTPSNSGVIDVGTNGWVCAITSSCSWQNTATSETAKQVSAITQQILIAGALGPLALSHPEVSNISARDTEVPICVASCVNAAEEVVDTN